MLGILLINIPAFALPVDAATGPMQIGAETALDRFVTFWTEMLVEGTARGAFGMLFGAGVILLSTRLESSGRPSADIHLRRNMWLILFGIIHGYLLLWTYDILYTYGIIGVFLFVFRKCQPKTLIALGLLLIVPIVLTTAAEISEFFETEEQALAYLERADAGQELTESEQEALDDWLLAQDGEPDEELAEELTSTFRSGYETIFAHRSAEVFEQHTTYFYTVLLWDSASFMLIGMGLFKLGVLTGARSIRFYVVLATAGYAIAGAARGIEWWFALAPDLTPAERSLRWLLYDTRRLPMTIAHLSVVIALAKLASGTLVVRALASTGKMALTNYIGQTLICSALFYGVGIGLFGSLGSAEVLGVALCICLAQIMLSSIWLSRFRYGPLEWGWRSLTYWRRQPLRRN